MKRLLSTVLSISALALITVPVSASAIKATERTYPEIPEVSGIYTEPGKPNIKVRVSVYHARSNAKPAPAMTVLTCGLPDNDSLTIMPTTGWKLPSTVTYRLNPASVPATVKGKNLATITSNSFQQWSNATDGKVTFTKGTDTTTARQALDGQNVIAWGRVTNPSALAVTYTRYNTATGLVVDNDTIFNKAFSWYWSDQDNCAYQNVYDAENIMTHELGHWVGLADEYTPDYENNTMFGYGSTGEVKKNTLTTGDISTVKKLYN